MVIASLIPQIPETITARFGQTEMTVRRGGGNPPARRALQITLSNQIRLEHILDGGRREIVNADRSAAELVDHRLQQLAIHDIKPDRINIEHFQRTIGDRARDPSVRAHLGEIANAAQQAVGDARRAA